MIDVKATLVDGAFHDVDSSVLAFEIAARAAFKELREKGGPKLLEPIMAVEVVTPEEYLGSVIGDLNGLILPHPRAAERRFVMGPIAEIAPDWVHPAGGDAAALAGAAGVGKDAHPI